MTSRKTGKSKSAAKRRPRDLSAGKTSNAKGGSKVMANAHEMKKALIGNFPR